VRKVSCVFENRRRVKKGGEETLNEHQEVHESSADTTLDNSLDLVVGSVRKVLGKEETRQKIEGELDWKEGRRRDERRRDEAHRDGPASVDEDLVVERVDELGENGQSGRDLERKRTQGRGRFSCSLNNSNTLF